MKRKTSDTDPGGRLRLALLLATAAAFLLVPASQALAAPVGHLKVILSGTGAGEVNTEGGGEIGENHGTPTIHCNKPSKGGDFCENTMDETGGPGSEFWESSLRAVPAPGSEFAEWKVLEGEELEFGVACYTEKKTPECALLVLETGGEVEAVFKKKKNVIVMTVGAHGHVVDSKGSPPIACPETNCEAALTPTGGAISDELVATPDPGYEVDEWTFTEGFEAKYCEPGETKCSASNFSGQQIHLTVTFKLKPVPKWPLTATATGGTGSGTVKCKINGGSEVTCPAEVEEGAGVEVISHAAVGSVLTAWSGECSGSGACSFTMPGHAASVNGQFDLETFELTLNAGEHGTLTAECTPPGGPCASLTEIPYGTSVKVTATPESEYALASLIGTNSAAGSCEVGTKMCTFVIKADSEVSAEFVSEAIRDSFGTKVWGEVPQTTKLETTCPEEVYLGKFIPNLQHNETYAKTCGLTVTATGMKNVLTAADKTGEAVGRLGHLVQPSYSLAEPLETMATDTEGLGGTSGTGGKLAPLTSPVTLLTYGTPVNDDAVLLEFSQLIKQHDPLHTGVYSKVITVTLEQTEP